MGKTVGALIKEARTAAKLTQEKLAAALGDAVSAADISKAERGEIDFSQATLKKIASLTGVTQASLVNAAKEEAAAAGKTTAKTASKTTAAKTSSAKTSTAKSTTAKSGTKSATASKSTSTKSTATAKSTTKSTAAKTTTPANANISMKVTSTEQKLIELYRTADSNTRKSATSLLKGESQNVIETLLNSMSSSVSGKKGGDSLGDLIAAAIGNLGK